MTPAELVSDIYAIGPQDLAVIFQLIADYLYELRLHDGSRVVDASDCKQLLEELSAEAKRRMRRAS